MRLNLGDVVCLEFLDHCHRSGEVGEAGPLPFEVYGKIVEVGPTYFTVASWVSPYGVDNNAETFVIVKSTITKARRLR